MQIGFIGLGKMGSRMAVKLLRDNHDVVAWNRSQEAISNFKFQISNSQSDTKVTIAGSVEDLIKKLKPPRVIWLMLTAGEPTESVLTEVAKDVESGDIVIDGGNAFYKDTQRRFETFELNKVRFLGVGVSGGVHALQNGYPMMVGGDASAYQYVTPLLESLAKPRGRHAYFGTGGAGHFVKMIHNGIEYGMMQAIGEGFGILDKAPYDVDLLEVVKLWQKSTIISGFLIDRTRDALEKEPHLEKVSGEIAASGEGEWTVQQGKTEGVPVEGIEQALEFRKKSQTDKEIADSFAAKLVSALRHEFGGHALPQVGDAKHEVKKK